MKLTVDPASLTMAFRDLWDDATNAVCQAMQEQEMCNCPDGDCLAAKVWPSAIDLTNASRQALASKGGER